MVPFRPSEWMTDIITKEERVEFGTEEGGKIRILGSWIGGREDVSNRIKRAGGLWWMVKAKLKGSRLSRRWQARIVEACVESALLFDCGVGGGRTDCGHHLRLAWLLAVHA